MDTPTTVEMLVKRVGNLKTWAENGAAALPRGRNERIYHERLERIDLEYRTILKSISEMLDCMKEVNALYEDAFVWDEKEQAEFCRFCGCENLPHRHFCAGEKVWKFFQENA